MARIRNIVMEGATGRLGSMVLTQRTGTGTVARTLAPEVSNPKSDAQQTRRVKWANLVNFYKVSKGWMSKAFENKAANQSDYNKFMSLNANTSMVALTKDQAGQGGVIAGPYTISQGSLPSIGLTRTSTGAWATNIDLGTLVISNTTTVAELSQAITANNAQIKEGMQLSFISYQQQTNTVTGVPFCVAGWYEITLNSSDARTVHSVMPTTFAAATVDNGGKYLGTGPQLSSGAFAYILSDRQGGKLLVSTQQLTVNDSEVYNEAITTAALNAAIESYGRGTEVFLAPGYAGGGQQQSQVNNINRVIIGSGVYTPGVSVIQVTVIQASPNNIELEMANPITAANISDINFRLDNEAARDRHAQTFNVQGSKITITGWQQDWESVGSTRKLSHIFITMVDGKTYTAEFPDQVIIG